MKKIVALVVGMLGLGWLHADAAPQLPPRYFVVCTTEMDKSEDYQVLPADEFKLLVDEVKAETALFPRALENARMEWLKDETLKKKMFPKSALSPRKVDAMGPPFTDQDKALKKVENIEDAAAKRDERKQQQQKQRTDGRKRAGHQGDAGKHDKGKDDTLSKAVDMVRAELEKLKSAAPAKPAAGGAKPAANPE